MTTNQVKASNLAREAAMLWQNGVITVHELNDQLRLIESAYNVEPFCVRWPFQTGTDYIFMPGISSRMITSFIHTN